MHRYRIVAQISLIFSILNLVHAAPIVAQKIHEARRDEMAEAEDVTMLKKWRKSEAASMSHSTPDARAFSQDPSSHDTSTSSQDPSLQNAKKPSQQDSSSQGPSTSQQGSSSSQDVKTSSQDSPSPDALAHAQEPPSPSGSTSSGYSYDTPVLSDPTKPDYKYAWMVDRPGLLSLPPESLYNSDAESPRSSPHPSLASSESPETLWWMPPHMPGDTPPIDFASVYLPFHPLLPPTLPSPTLSSSSGNLGPLEIPSSPQLMGSVRTPTAESISGEPVPFPMPEESMPSVQGPAVPLQHPMPESPPHHPTTDPSSSPSPSPNPENARLFDLSLKEKIALVTGVVIVGGTIATIAGVQVKHHEN